MPSEQLKKYEECIDNVISFIDFNSIPIIDIDTRPEMYIYISELKKLRDFVIRRNPSKEHAMIMFEDKSGNLRKSEMFVGKSGYIKMPQIKGARGGIHNHPNKYIKVNYLLSIGDIMNLSKMIAVEDLDYVIEGVTDYKGRSTITVVNRDIRQDDKFYKFVRDYYRAIAIRDREMVIDVGVKCIDYLSEKGILQVYRVCDE